jgi:hypothetical protein
VVSDLTDTLSEGLTELVTNLRQGGDELLELDPAPAERTKESTPKEQVGEPNVCYPKACRKTGSAGKKNAEAHPEATNWPPTCTSTPPPRTTRTFGLLTRSALPR